jgi:hypothetical protein
MKDIFGLNIKQIAFIVVLVIVVPIAVQFVRDKVKA